MPTTFDRNDIATSAINVSNAGDNTIVIPGAGGKVKVLSMCLFAPGGANNVIFKSGANTLTGPIAIPTGAAAPLFVATDEIPLFFTFAGSNFVMNFSAATQVTGWVTYIIES